MTSPEGRPRNDPPPPEERLGTAPPWASADAPPVHRTLSAVRGRTRPGSALGTVTLLAGVWLLIAPFALGYTDDAARWNDIVLGVVVLVLALAGLLVRARSNGARPDRPGPS